MITEPPTHWNSEDFDSQSKEDLPGIAGAIRVSKGCNYPRFATTRCTDDLQIVPTLQSRRSSAADSQWLGFATSKRMGNELPKGDRWTQKRERR